MKYFKLSIKFLVLMPIAFSVDIIASVIKGLVLSLELIEEHASWVFDKALAWCNNDK
tara:strand:+ start:869 stop:1039 length:171 start_codon:yes stop_codon:yes gene_type:complete